ncbi:MAG: CbtB-domain containing protein [Streptosporangiales bacterium]|nr:CbtB-domain containing protein [Streptosporangiales bacterium]
MASPAVPVRSRVPGLPWWSLVVVAAALFVVYAVLQENGVALGQVAQVVHEFFHDGRHALGVPCH